MKYHTHKEWNITHTKKHKNVTVNELKKEHYLQHESWNKKAEHPPYLTAAGNLHQATQIVAPCMTMNKHEPHKYPFRCY
jgi:hypothetical protein